jgi:hypothetical protein
LPNSTNSLLRICFGEPEISEEFLPSQARLETFVIDPRVV